MHEIIRFTEKENCDRNKVLRYAQDIADRNGDHKGQIHTIRWIERTICDNEDAAYTFINENDKGWYDNLAVRFYDYSSVNMKKTKKVETLEERVKTLRSRLHTLETTPYAETLTSTEFVGCKHCGSKIATKFLKGNHCPVCGADMRPKTTLDRIASTKARIATTEDEIREEKKSLQMKQRKNAKVEWLVKIEFHS
jgi:hypothetical protein